MIFHTRVKYHIIIKDIYYERDSHMIIQPFQEGVYILSQNFIIAPMPKVWQARDENFYNCPQFACCMQWNIFNLSVLWPLLDRFKKNWANFDIILSKSVKIITKSLLNKFLLDCVNLCHFFLFLPFYYYKIFISVDFLIFLIFWL